MRLSSLNFNYLLPPYLFFLSCVSSKFQPLLCSASEAESLAGSWLGWGSAPKGLLLSPKPEVKNLDPEVRLSFTSRASLRLEASAHSALWTVVLVRNLDRLLSARFFGNSQFLHHCACFPPKIWSQNKRPTGRALQTRRVSLSYAVPSL